MLVVGADDSGVGDDVACDLGVRQGDVVNKGNGGRPAQDVVAETLDQTIELLDGLEVPHLDGSCQLCCVVRECIRHARDHAIVNGETGDEMRARGVSHRQVMLYWGMTIDWATEVHELACKVLEAHLSEGSQV